MDATFPYFPFIRSIKLYDVNVSNLYELLSKTSSTLTELWLLHIKSDSPYKFLPTPPQGQIKDVPPIITLFSLEKLKICGSSPLLWGEPTTVFKEFLTEMPVLKEVSFRRQGRFEEDFGFYEACQTLSAEVLATFFRSSPSLKSYVPFFLFVNPLLAERIPRHRVDFTDTNLTTEMLLTALPYASRTLTKLILKNVGSDVIVDRLHTLVPSLTYLNVENEEFHTSQYPPHPHTVSLPALARLASKLRSHSPLLRWLGKSTLLLVGDQPYHNPEADPNSTLSQLRIELRNALAVLSPTQVRVLIDTQLKLRDYPGAVEWNAVKEEVLSLVKSVGVGKGGMPATLELITNAKTWLRKWELRREDDACVGFVEKLNGVKLLFDPPEEDEDDEV